MINRQNNENSKQNKEKKADNKMYEFINRMSKKDYDKFVSRILLDCKNL